MKENLAFKADQQPQLPDKVVPPNILFLEKLSRLETELKELTQQIAVADEEKKEFLQIRILDVKKKIANYHQSLGKYRKTDKLNQLKDLAGEDRVSEVINFKPNRQQPETERTGIGKNFLKDLEKFKNRKKPNN